MQIDAPKISKKYLKQGLVAKSGRLDGVFISHSSHNSERALAWAEAIEDHVCSAWLSSRDSQNDDNILKDLDDVIRSCSLFVLLLCQNAIKSPYVNNEIGIAVAHSKPIHSIYLEKCKPTDGMLQIIAKQYSIDDGAKILDVLAGIERFIFPSIVRSQINPKSISSIPLLTTKNRHSTIQPGMSERH